MPLDSTVSDPHVAAGLVQGPDGTWGLPDAASGSAAPAVHAAPAPASTTTVDLAGNPVALPANLPALNLPQISTPAPPPAPPPADDDNVIDVRVGTPKETATPDLDATMARLRATVGNPAASPPAESPKPEAPKATTPHVAAGLVQFPDGTWGLPDASNPAPAPGAPAAPTAPAPAIPASVKDQEVRNQPWYQPLADTVDGITGAATHGATLGLDEIVSPIPAAIARSLADHIPFTQAYTEEVQRMRQPRTNFESEHPTAGAAVETVAGLPAAAATGPLFTAARPGASIAAQGLNAARNVGVGTAAGGATGFTMTDGDVSTRLEGAKQGAELGGVLTAATPLIAGIGKTLGSVPSAVRPIVNPDGAAAQQVGRVLTEQAPGPVPTMTPSPIPGMPLNVAQASGSPELASLVDTHNAAHVAGMNRERSAQNQAMLGELPGSPKGAVPENTAARTSITATGKVQEAAELISKEEKRLWNKASLTKPNVSTETAKKAVADEVAALHKDNPGLALAYDESGVLRRTVTELNGMPEKAAANEINAISSRLRAVARDPGEPDDVRSIARRLANTVQDGIWQAPEIAGRAPQPTGVLTYPGPGQAAGPPKMGMTPDVKADPQLKADLLAARAFTKREAGVLGHASFDNILKRNSRSNLVGTPGTALNRFFDFANGVERPGAIKNVTGFLNDIRGEWLKLSAAEQAEFSPAAVAQVQKELVDNGRDFIVAKMLGRVSGTMQDLQGDRMIQTAQLRKWLSTNRAMIDRSGMFTPAQLDALDRVGDAADLIQRGYEQGRPMGSPTYSRLSGDRFIDAFLSPVMRHVIGSGLGGGIGAVLGHLGGEANLGVLLGVGLEGTPLGTHILNRLYSLPHQRAMELLDRAIRDPAVAKDLMMQATVANAKKVSPATIAFLKSALAEQPAAQAMRTYGPGDAQ